MNIKKIKRQVISSFFAIFVAIFAIVFSSIAFGWFSKNERVEATSMSIKAEATSNLLISEDEEKIISEQYISSPTPFEISLTGAKKKLKPATHSSSSATLLKYVDELNMVDKLTGLAKSGGTLSFADCPENSDYYQDFVLYISSAHKEITNASLSVIFTNKERLSSSGEYVDTTYSTHKALSIDFYIDSVSNDNYKGTLNIAGIDNNNSGNEVTQVVLLEDGSTIPLNTEGSIKLILRFYFDGALLDSTGRAYINRALVETSEIKVGLKFIAEESEE